MGKHSIEKERKKINKKHLIIIILMLIILVFVFDLKKEYVEEEIKTLINSDDITVSKTIEGKKLIIKSKIDYNRIIEYIFENDILKEIKIYEQFQDRIQFETTKNNYEKIDNIEIISINEQEQSIEIKKKDFESDTNKSYEEIYNKYLVQLVDIYELIS